MSYKEKWTRFTLLFITVLALAAWGLVWLVYWLFSNIIISWGV